MLLSLSGGNTLAVGSSAVQAVYRGSELKHFNPKAIPGLGLWLDASDIASLSQTSDGGTPVAANSDPVAYWQDKITGAALTQTIDANRPLWVQSGIGGRPALDFDGSNDVLFTESGPICDIVRNVPASTVVACCKIGTAINQQGILFLATRGTSAGARLIIGRLAADGSAIELGGRRLDADLFAAVSGSPGSNTLAESVIVATRNSDGTASLRVDGADDFLNQSFLTSGSTSDTSSVAVAVGGTTSSGTCLDMLLAEMLVWKRALTAPEINAVERYLSQKHGVALG